MYINSKIVLSAYLKRWAYYNQLPAKSLNTFAQTQRPPHCPLINPLSPAPAHSGSSIRRSFLTVSSKVLPLLLEETTITIFDHVATLLYLGSCALYV